MINLAGKNQECDAQVAGELALAGIEIVRNDKPCNGEVKTTITGKLGKFTFKRFWYYWVVDGPMPLDVAERMYQDPVGKKFVRVAGHCGCPDPKDWASYFDVNGKKLIKPLSESEKNIANLLPTTRCEREMTESFEQKLAELAGFKFPQENKTAYLFEGMNGQVYNEPLIQALVNVLLQSHIKIADLEDEIRG